MLKPCNPGWLTIIDGPLTIKTRSRGQYLQLKKSWGRVGLIATSGSNIMWNLVRVANSTRQVYVLKVDGKNKYLGAYLKTYQSLRHGVMTLDALKTPVRLAPLAHAQYFEPLCDTSSSSNNVAFLRVVGTSHFLQSQSIFSKYGSVSTPEYKLTDRPSTEFIFDIV